MSAIEVLPDPSSGAYSVNPAEIRALSPEARARLARWVRRVNALPHVATPTTRSAALTALGRELRGAQLELIPATEDDAGKVTLGQATVTAGTYELRLRVEPASDPARQDPTSWETFAAAFTPPARAPADKDRQWLAAGSDNSRASRGGRGLEWTGGVWTWPDGARLAGDGAEVRWTGAPGPEAPAFTTNLRKVRGVSVPVVPEPPTPPALMRDWTQAPADPVWRATIDGASLRRPGDHLAWRLSAAHVGRPAIAGEGIAPYRLDWPADATLLRATDAVFGVDLARLRSIIGQDVATLTIGDVAGQPVLRVDLPGDRHAVLARLDKSAAIDAVSPETVLARTEDTIVDALEHVTRCARESRPLRPDDDGRLTDALAELDVADAAGDHARAALADWHRASEPAPAPRPVAHTPAPAGRNPAGGPALEHDPDAHRVRLRFAEPVPDDLARELDAAGWNWSPKNAAWQRRSTRAALAAANDWIARLTPAPLA